MDNRDYKYVLTEPLPEIVQYEMWSEWPDGTVRRESIWTIDSLEDAQHATDHCNKYNAKYQDTERTYFVMKVRTVRERNG